MALQGSRSKDKNTVPVIDADGIVHDEDELAFFKNYGNFIIILVIIVAIAVALFGIMRNYNTATQNRSAELFNKAETIKEFNDLIATFPEAETIPLARINLGAEHYRAGSYAKAITVFEEFIAMHPEHEFLANAKLNLAIAQEASGNLAKATENYKALSGDTKHYLYGQAVMGHARVLSAKNKYAEAKAIYEDFIANSDSQVWVRQAEEMLKTVSAKLQTAE